MPWVLKLPDDPVRAAKVLWPDIQLYTQQAEMLRSAFFNDETVVRAGNMLGKDFTAAIVCVLFFLTRHPCRIVTTSAKAEHLKVLWGEINQRINTSAQPLTVDKGGSLQVSHLLVRKEVDGVRCPISYLNGMVAGQDSIAAMQGHHVANTGDGIPRTMAVIDEASSVPDAYLKMFRGWANRILIFGNPWPCANFFFHAFKGKPGTEDKGGNIPRPGGGYYRKTLKIEAEDSPNVRFARLEQALGRTPSNHIKTIGVKGWAEYQKNLATMDPIDQCVSLRAEFYEGSDLLMYPPLWLNRAEEIARCLVSEGKPRIAKGIGIDPAEGGDKTAMAAVDEFGLIELVSRKTPNTNDIVGEALAFIHRHKVPSERVCIDRGGGGKQHADRLRSAPHNLPIRTVAFGESLMPELKRGIHLFGERVEHREEHYVYFNRRAQMYGELRLLLDPSLGPGFALPREYYQIRQQLAVIPLLHDGEGRLILPPKNKRGDVNVKNQTKKTLVELIGHSPDEADALVLAIHAMLHKASRVTAGAVT